jgi:nucleoside-diphosphate-sugar epimerase
MIEVVRGDLGMPDTLRGCLHDCSLVYHCAAKLTGSDRAQFEAVNVGGTEALLREAEREGVERFNHASTIGVYACSDAENIDEELPWPETHHSYFATKQAAERAVWASAGKVPFTIARLGDVFGPGQHVWTIDLIRQLQRGALYPPTEAESGLFNPVYIDNAIDALVLLGTHPLALGEAFNVVDGRPRPFSEYIRRLARISGRRTFALPGFVMKAGASLLMALDLLSGREASTNPDDVDYLLHKGTISGEKIRSLLGWQPAVSEEAAFHTTEEWLRREGLIPAS